MGPRLFNILAVGSLGLCLVTATLWLRSYFRSDTMRWPSATTSHEAVSCRGSLGYSWLRWAAPSTSRAETAKRWPVHASAAATPDPDPLWRRQIEDLGGTWFLGFGYLVTHPGERRIASFGLVSVPIWSLLLLTAAPPALWLWRRLRHRPRPGHCPTCDYDLTANVSGVCPECGTPVADR